MRKHTSKPQSPDEKRSCERIPVRQNIKLQIEGGAYLECTSTDISLGGIALTCKAKIKGNLQGLKTRFSLENSSEKFDCTIVRQNSSHIAIEIDRKQAALFGKLLSRLLLVH